MSPCTSYSVLSSVLRVNQFTENSCSLLTILPFYHQDASSDNRSEETGGQEEEKDTATEAMDDFDFSFSGTKKKKRKKKVCQRVVYHQNNMIIIFADFNVFRPYCDDDLRISVIIEPVLVIIFLI